MYAYPLRNGPIEGEEKDYIKSHAAELVARSRLSYLGFLHHNDPRAALEVSPAQRHAHFEAIWQARGFPRGMPISMTPLSVWKRTNCTRNCAREGPRTYQGSACCGPAARPITVATSNWSICATRRLNASQLRVCRTAHSQSTIADCAAYRQKCAEVAQQGYAGSEFAR